MSSAVQLVSSSIATWCVQAGFLHGLLCCMHAELCQVLHQAMAIGCSKHEGHVMQSYTSGIGWTVQLVQVVQCHDQGSVSVG